MYIEINNTKIDTDSLEMQLTIIDTLGHEFLNYINTLKSEADYTTRKLDTDLQAYEGQLDSYSSLMSDTMDALTETISYIEDAKKLDKQRVINQLQKALKDINNQL